MDRRGVIGGALALAAMPGGIAAAAPSARALMRRGIVINGNLAVPLDPDGALPATLAAEIRTSGLTAAKLSLGGSGNRTAAETMAEIAETDRGIAANAALFLKVREVADFTRAKASGRVGIIPSFEAAEMLEGRLDAVDRFAAAGIRVMGLSYNRDTPFASGVLSQAHGGLTPLGREAVARMNARRVTIDVSHSDEPSSLAAIAVSTQPVLITHAGCAAIHAHPRNKSDALLRALAARGGVIGIFELSYLAPPPMQPTLELYLAHLTHALDRCGEDGVAIGSDASLTRFDTSSAAMAAWNAEIARRRATGVAAPGEGPPPFAIGLNRPDRMGVIADALLRRGVRARTVEKVLGTNLLRVFTQTWE